MTRRLLIVVVAAVVALAAARPARGVTDDEVCRSIERAREYLLNLRNPDGSFTADPKWRGCYTSLILMTLAYMGEHPNREVMSKGMTYLLSLDPARDFNEKQGYALPIRVMAMAYLHNKLTDEKRALARKVMAADLNLILQGQSGTGGWRYLLNRVDYDYSATQWPLLAIMEAGRVGLEFPKEPLLAARAFYVRGQHPDGGWGYQFGGKSYGAMTAAGLASLYILSDLCEPASGCPCRAGQSTNVGSETERRMDAALGWLDRNFTAQHHAGWPFQTNFDEVYYWLYSMERVGIAAGYKHFGRHNWYREGAEVLLSRQLPDGAWEQIDPKIRTFMPNWGGGKVPDTCFALLFLFKGRAPVLFNKLRFDGAWNPHRRDIANLTRYIEWSKEQQFHWQIVDIAAPLEELHDAPVLFLSAESPPRLTPDDKRKLRAFTDTGGTLLVEASCGNPPTRKALLELFKEVWPEWPLRPLGADHAVFLDPYPLTHRPELMGLGDGERTFLFYSMDDISCPWHTRAFSAKEYLFHWGINLFTYAMDRSPLRAKLADAAPPKAARYLAPPVPGPRKAVRLARVRHGGNWEAGANYAAFAALAAYFEKEHGIAFRMEESNAVPVTRGGLAADNLAGCDVAFLTGSGAFTLTDAEKAGLAAFVARGGFVWAEAAAGSAAFDAAFRAIAGDLGWTLAPLAPEHPLMTGRLGPARGYDLRSGVEFRRALRVPRIIKPWAELWGITVGGRLAGVYSPFDAVSFAFSPYEAYNCRGYKTDDAAAVVMNIALSLTVPQEHWSIVPPAPPLTEYLLLVSPSALPPCDGLYSPLPWTIAPESAAQKAAVERLATPGSAAPAPPPAEVLPPWMKNPG